MHNVKRKIGPGCRADVYEVCTDVGRQLAVKRLHAAVQEDSESRTAFFDSTRKWARWSHDGIVRFHDLDRLMGAVSMELMARSAAQLIIDAPASPALVLGALKRCLRALQPIHASQIHANLKPTNIFFDESGKAFLSDGLGLEYRRVTTIPIPSTQKHIAPEQNGDTKFRLTPATDLYCLGFVALEMLAGPSFNEWFTGVTKVTKDTDIAWLRWHESANKAPSAASVCPGCPNSLAVVIDRLLLKSTADRYQNAEQALRDLPADLAEQNKSTSPKSTPKPTATSKNSSQYTPTLDDLLERPKQSVLFQVASGQDIGNCFGTDDDDISIGFKESCSLRFDKSSYPKGGASVRVHRGAEGWKVEAMDQFPVLVNEKLCERDTRLRVGDIIRLSPYGPDVQFSLQTGGQTLVKICSQYLRRQKTKPPVQSTHRPPPPMSQPPMSQPPRQEQSKSSAQAKPGGQGTDYELEQNEVESHLSPKQSAGQVDLAPLIDEATKSPPSRPPAPPKRRGKKSRSVKGRFGSIHRGKLKKHHVNGVLGAILAALILFCFLTPDRSTIANEATSPSPAVSNETSE